jgi:aspartate aminotransferase
VIVSAPLSRFAQSLSVETAFSVLAVAKRLKAEGKDVVELEIGDSPFNTTGFAKKAGIDAIKANWSRYCPSPGLPEVREAAARYVSMEFGVPAKVETVVRT